jgi:uncharacterized protein
MDILLLITLIVFMLLGLAGAIIPGLPGPALSWLALIALHFTSWITYSTEFLFIMGLIAAAVTLLDYYVPIYGTKKFGGTKTGVRGSLVGLIVGVIVLPVLGIFIGPFGLLGIILGPFVGALIGENIAGTPSDKALRAAFGSFMGFLAGTMIKVIYALVVIFFIIRDIFVLVFYGESAL